MVGPCKREGASGADPAGLFDRVLFDAIAAARDSLRLTCLMGSVPALPKRRFLRAAARIV